nr:nucleotidyltransferase [Nocardia transvalensis]
MRALTRAANSLAAEGVRFAVAGGCAVYARGGPASDHDVDLFIKPADIDRARHALSHNGLRLAEPAENWLTKAYDGATLIDLIHRPNNREVTDEILDRAEEMRVGPTVAPVVSATDLLTDKMLVFDAHRLDFAPLLHIARDLREQVDWPQVRANTAHSPYARAFTGLLADLGIVEREGAS